MKPLYYAVACVAAAVAVGVALLALPDAKQPAAAEPAVEVRYMPTAQLMRELAPFATRFPGEALGIVGVTCHVSVSSPLNRIVIVCK